VHTSAVAKLPQAKGRRQNLINLRNWRPGPFAAHRGANAGPYNHPGHRSYRTGERTRPQ